MAWGYRIIDALGNMFFVKELLLDHAIHGFLARFRNGSFYVQDHYSSKDC